ncbi:osteocalcin 2-like isoform X2 [Dunckerocampus dactyliophorus]|uniref:osteocalcin 2-like isoform X2 n=1 Tax=Dunckerocampus dactyliophorus TaxID=161453 RepID=UPI002405141E|nr:osteocalcin 2-like isoform X2 [Dunckerocampus dactyliophorus]
MTRDDVRKESSSTLQVPDPEYPSTSKFLIRGIPKSSSSSNCIPSSSTSSSSSSSTSSSPAETHLGPPPNSPTSSSSSSSSSSSPSSSSTSSSSSPSSSSSDNWICVSDDQDKVVLKRLPTGAHNKLHATGKNLVRRPQLRWVRKIMKDRNKQRRRKKAATNSEYAPPQ